MQILYFFIFRYILGFLIHMIYGNIYTSYQNMEDDHNEL